MIPGAIVIFAVAGVVTAIMAAMGKAPTWLPSLLTGIAVLLMVIPK